MVVAPWPGTPDPDDDDLYDYREPIWPEVTVTDNPVTAELLGPDGAVIRQWTERPPIGFALPS